MSFIGAVPPALAALAALRDREQRIRRAKEAMAMAGHKLLSGPEQAMSEFKVLIGLLADPDRQVHNDAPTVPGSTSLTAAA